MARNKNYDMFNESVKTVSIRSKLDATEMILWQGKPNEKSFNYHNEGGIPLFFVAIWATFDLLMLTGLFASGLFFENIFILPIVIGFFGLHMMPVWIFLKTLKRGKKKWAETEYAITNQSIIIKSGYKDEVITKYNLDEIKEITLRREKLDKKLGTGDILITLKDDIFVDLLDLVEYEKAFRIIRENVDLSKVEISQIEEMK